MAAAEDALLASVGEGESGGRGRMQARSREGDARRGRVGRG